MATPPASPTSQDYVDPNNTAGLGPRKGAMVYFDEPGGSSGQQALILRVINASDGTCELMLPSGGTWQAAYDANPSSPSAGFWRWQSAGPL